MITAIFDVVAEGLKAFNQIEANLNRPDMVHSAIAKARQKYRDAVEQAQAIIADPHASGADRWQAFHFIQKIES